MDRFVFYQKMDDVYNAVEQVLEDDFEELNVISHLEEEQLYSVEDGEQVDAGSDRKYFVDALDRNGAAGFSFVVESGTCKTILKAESNYDASLENVLDNVYSQF